RQADDADSVVDLVLLRPSPGAELERGDADADCAERNDSAVGGSLHRPHDRRPRQRVEARIPALRANPAFVELVRRAVRDRGLRPTTTLVDVDLQVGEGEQPRARLDHELREVRRPLAADGVDRLADLERVADRGPERLVHVGEQADDLLAGTPTRKPGIASSLSSVPPVWPRPRPLIFPNGTPQAATIGATAIDVLSPTPPVECLSTTLRPSAAPRSSVSPLRIIASVSAWVSAGVRPRK